jgi:uncharacterized protein YndB with AHSA1/START domain
MRGDGAPSPPAPPAHSEDLVFSFAFAADAGTVFDALTDATRLERWFCDRAQSEARTLGRLAFTWTRADAPAETWEGRWTLVDRPRACVYEGGHAGYPDGYAGRVRFALAPQGARTRLEVTHQFPARAPWAPFVARYRDAWPRALARLQRHLEPKDAP